MVQQNCAMLLATEADLLERDIDRARGVASDFALHAPELVCIGCLSEEASRSIASGIDRIDHLHRASHAKAPLAAVLLMFVFAIELVVTVILSWPTFWHQLFLGT